MNSGRVPGGTGLSQAEPQEGLGPSGFDPSRGWIITIGDWPYFEIVKAEDEAGDCWSNEGLNGLHPTKLAALEYLITGFEQSREKLAGQIARAKRMRQRLHRDSDGSPQGGDACGSVHDSAGPKDIAEPQSNNDEQIGDR